MNRQVVGVLAVLTAVVLWGIQFPVAKATVDNLDPFHATAIRYTAGTLLLIPVFVWLEGRSALHYYGRFWPATLFGLVGMCLSPMLVFYGISLTHAEHAAVIVALQPSMTALADWALRGRRPAAFTLSCIAVAFLGVVVVVTRGDPLAAFDRGEVIGGLFVLGGAVCWVIYTMATENFRGWSALRFTTLTLIPGTAGTILFTAVFVAIGWADVPTGHEVAAVGWELFYLSLAGIVVSMFCWNAGNQRIGPINTMLIVNLLPVVTFAVRIGQGHRFVPAELAGAALVIGALVANNVYLRTVARQRRLAPAASAPPAHP